MMKKYGLIGEKLGHSCSPEIHSQLADYEYKLYELTPEQLPDFLRNCPLDGMNVTIPYKKAVVPFCSELSDRAKRTGSVNTLLRLPNGSFYGDNTDYLGFTYQLSKLSVPIEGKKCLVLGSGGASLTVQAVLAEQKAKEVIVISRTGENHYGNIARHFDAQIIVNTTPVGMYPDTERSPLSLRNFHALEGVADIVFNPRMTVFLQDAKDRGIPFAGGMSMLVMQAKAAAELFTGEKIPEGEVQRIEALMAERF